MDEAFTTEYLNEERTVDEVRYADSDRWHRAGKDAILAAVLGEPVAWRTLRQRRIRQTFADGHSVEGWETQEADAH